MIPNDMGHGLPACRRRGKLHRAQSRLKATHPALVSSARMMQALTPGIEPDAEGPLIEEETPLVPRAAAEGVWEEVSVYLQTELPASWKEYLAIRADVIYQRNEHFRGLIRRGGDTGRDWLWTFMRHWLAALIYRWDASLYSRLPASFSAGADLPSR